MRRQLRSPFFAFVLALTSVFSLSVHAGPKPKLSPLAAMLEKAMFKKVPGIAGFDPESLNEQTLKKWGVTEKQVGQAFEELLAKRPGYVETLQEGAAFFEYTRERLDGFVEQTLDHFGTDRNAPRATYISYQMMLRTLAGRDRKIIPEQEAENRGWRSFWSRGYQSFRKDENDGRVVRKLQIRHESDEDMGEVPPKLRQLEAWRAAQISRIDAKVAENAKSFLSMLGDHPILRKSLPSRLRGFDPRQMDDWKIEWLDEDVVVQIPGRPSLKVSLKLPSQILQSRFENEKAQRYVGDFAAMHRLALLNKSLREMKADIARMDFRKDKTELLSERLLKISNEHSASRSNSEHLFVPKLFRNIGNEFVAAIWAKKKTHDWVWSGRRMISQLNPAAVSARHELNGRKMRPKLILGFLGALVTSGAAKVAHDDGYFNRPLKVLGAAVDASTAKVKRFNPFRGEEIVEPSDSPFDKQADRLGRPQSLTGVNKKGSKETTSLFAGDLGRPITQVVGSPAGTADQTQSPTPSQSQQSAGSKSNRRGISVPAGTPEGKIHPKSEMTKDGEELFVVEGNAIPMVIELASHEDLDDAKLKPIQDIPTTREHLLDTVVPLVPTGKYVPIPILRGDRIAAIGLYNDEGRRLVAERDFDLYETDLGAPVAVLRNPEENTILHARVGSAPAKYRQQTIYFDPKILEVIRKELHAAGVAFAKPDGILAAQIAEAIREDRYVPASWVTDAVNLGSKYVYQKANNPNLHKVPESNYYRREAEDLDERGCVNAQCSVSERWMNRIFEHYNSLSGGLEARGGMVANNYELDAARVAHFSGPFHIQEYLRHQGDELGVKEVHDATPPDHSEREKITEERSEKISSGGNATSEGTTQGIPKKQPTDSGIDAVKTAAALPVGGPRTEAAKAKETAKAKENSKSKTASKTPENANKQDAGKAATPEKKADPKTAKASDSSKALPANVAKASDLVEPIRPLALDSITKPPVEPPRLVAERHKLEIESPAPQDPVATGKPGDNFEVKAMRVADPRSVASTQEALGALRASFVDEESELSVSPRRTALKIAAALVRYGNGLSTFEDLVASFNAHYPLEAAVPRHVQDIPRALVAMAEHTEKRLSGYRELMKQRLIRDEELPAQATDEYAKAVSDFYRKIAKHNWVRTSKPIRAGEHIPCEAILTTLETPPRVVSSSASDGG